MSGAMAVSPKVPGATTNGQQEGDEPEERRHDDDACGTAARRGSATGACRHQLSRPSDWPGEALAPGRW